MHTMLQATEKGVPFMPLRGLIGSDILRHRPDWKVIDNPFADCGDPIVLLPAVAPDVALMHAPMADQEGNVYIGRRREMATLAHAAKRMLFTVERIYPGCFFDEESLAVGALSGLYVTAIAEAPRGAWPLMLGGEYETDGAHMHRYVQMAATPEGFAAYLDAFVFNHAAAAE
jgi:glutaconate CoA-transferase subunit A